jgi:hypothetical protein
MFDDLEDGVETAFVGVFVGLIISSVFEALGPDFALYSVLFSVFSLVGSIAVITKFKYWASGYLIGFIIAEWLLTSFNLETPVFAMIYSIIGVLIICLRFTEMVSDFLDDLW